MPRVNVPMQDGRTGYFITEAATLYKEETIWDGPNQISVATGSQWNHEALYRTKGGRWVLNLWSVRQGGLETPLFITPAKAKDWLQKNNHYEAVEKWFSKQQDEVGPAVAPGAADGRPEIGGRIDVVIGEHLRNAVDAHAKVLNMTRSEAVRLLLADALNVGK